MTLRAIHAVGADNVSKTECSTLPTTPHDIACNTLLYVFAWTDLLPLQMKLASWWSTGGGIRSRRRDVADRAKCAGRLGRRLRRPEVIDGTQQLRRDILSLSQRHRIEPPRSLTDQIYLVAAFVPNLHLTIFKNVLNRIRVVADSHFVSEIVAN